MEGFKSPLIPLYKGGEGARSSMVEQSSYTRLVLGSNPSARTLINKNILFSMKNNLPVRALLNSLGVFIYIVAIVLLLNNAQRIFGDGQTFWTPVVMLMLLVLSATITGFLVLGKPIMLYLENQKEAAVRLLCYTIGWLFAFTAITMIVLALLK